jgi:hypothetical protein
MRRTRWLWVALAVGVLFVAVAAADDVDSLFVDDLTPLAIGGLVALEVAIAVVEGLAYHYVARLTWRRALLTSFVANAASAVIGFVPAVIMGPLPMPMGLLVGLVLTVFIELPIVMLMNLRQPNRGLLLATALVANLVTYAAAAAVVPAVARAVMHPY